MDVWGGTLEIRGSTISNNRVLDGVGYAEAGGLRLSGTANSTVSIVNSTIANNRSIYDGGIRVWNNSAPITIVNSTIADNIGNEGAGIDNKSAGNLITLNNTIVARNTTIANVPADTFGSFNTSSSYNLVGTGAAGLSTLTAYGNQQGNSGSPVNPQLAPLGNYGGPTKTLALLAGSPAIDKGKNYLASLIDQRGGQRTYDFPGVSNASGGDGTDIGAFEAGTFTKLTVRVDDDRLDTPIQPDDRKFARSTDVGRTIGRRRSDPFRSHTVFIRASDDLPDSGKLRFPSGTEFQSKALVQTS